MSAGPPPSPTDRCASWVLTALALLFGVVAWVKTTAGAIRMAGLGRWLLTVVWSIVASIAVVLAMIGVTWALRAAREVYHPWYAHPGRLFVLLLAVGVTTGWGMSRARTLAARSARMGCAIRSWRGGRTADLDRARRHMALWLPPGAAYLWTLPLLTAGSCSRSRRFRANRGCAQYLSWSSPSPERSGCVTPWI